MFGVKKNDTISAMVTGQVEYIIAGLGNPGREYEGTRHNAGFIAIDLIAQKCGASIDRIKFKSLCGDAMLASKRVLLLKPQTFMNNSGEAITEAASFYKIKMENVIILFDDISLPPGKIRVRPKGSDGGHNGIKSIIYLSGTNLFPRIKIGVGAKPRPDYDLAAWVLGKPGSDDSIQITNALENAAEAVNCIIKKGAAEAMNKFN